MADPGAEFAFDVISFGFPVARWGYRFSPIEGGTEVTEYWMDRRGRGATVSGRIFTGKSATIRPEVNREGMRETLRRVKRLQQGPMDRDSAPKTEAIPPPRSRRSAVGPGALRTNALLPPW